MLAYLYPACCVQNQLVSIIKYSTIKHSSAPTSPGKILHWFNRRVQQADKSVEQFITNLYQLVEHCEYGGLKEEIFRD